MSSWETIELSMAVLLTSLTGGIMVILWHLAGRILEKSGFTNAIFELLKAVTVFFFLPISFVILKNPAVRQRLGRGYLFRLTPALVWSSRIFLGLWVVGMIFHLFCLVRHLILLHRKTRGMFPCDSDTERQFREIYQRLGGVENDLKLYQSYQFEVPCVIGVMDPKLILPVKKFSEEELQVIFTHEIIHYLQKDLVLKRAALILRAVHFFNPLSWVLYRDIQRWSEYACDSGSCRILGERKQYFEVIINMAVNSSGTAVISQLAENRNELEGRIKKFAESCGGKPLSRLLTFSAAATVLLAGALFACAVAGGSAGAYLWLYRLTETAVEEENLSREELAVRMDEVSRSARSASGFIWTVEEKGVSETREFICEKGEYIALGSRIEPDHIEVRVGIVEPGGNVRYINEKGDSPNYVFAITGSGRYRIFVENPSETPVCYFGSVLSNDPVSGSDWNPYSLWNLISLGW